MPDKFRDGTSGDINEILIQKIASVKEDNTLAPVKPCNGLFRKPHSCFVRFGKRGKILDDFDFRHTDVSGWDNRGPAARGPASPL
jgi:hypothetical protein